MCGIGGYIYMKPNKVSAIGLQTIARNLLLELEVRGRDATGYGYVSTKDKFAYAAKAPLKASDFLGVSGHLLSKSNLKSMPWAILLHTRAATKGLPSNNGNNHPIYSKASGLCMIHNGWVLNDDDLAKTFNLNRDAEVDTEIYLRLIEHFYLLDEKRSVPAAIAEATKHVYGSFACAMVQGGAPGSLWLWRTQGDLNIVKSDFGYAFASTMKALINGIYLGSKSADITHIVWQEFDYNRLVQIN